ncbi:MAG: hypothetical protein RLZZ414_22 [Bacteroidota bacterium]|jgi:outer membrane protein
MKKIIIGAFLALTTMGSIAQKNSKIGHVDYDKLVSLSAVSEKVPDKLQQTAGELQQILEQEQKRYDRDVREYLEEREKLSDMMKKAREESLQKRQVEMQQSSQKFQQVLNEEQNKLAQPIINKVNAAVEKYAKENGYLYILEKSGVIYAGGDDVTEALVKILGLENVKLPEGGLQGFGNQ